MREGRQSEGNAARLLDSRADGLPIGYRFRFVEYYRRCQTEGQTAALLHSNPAWLLGGSPGKQARGLKGKLSAIDGERRQGQLKIARTRVRTHGLDVSRCHSSTLDERIPVDRKGSGDGRQEGVAGTNFGGGKRVFQLNGEKSSRGQNMRLRSGPEGQSSGHSWIGRNSGMRTFAG